MPNRINLDLRKPIREVEDVIYKAVGFYKIDEGSFYVYMNRKDWKKYTKRIVYYGSDYSNVMFVDKENNLWKCLLSAIFIKECTQHETVRGIYDKGYLSTKESVERSLKGSVPSFEERFKKGEVL